VASRLPNFGYQLQLASGLVEEKIQTKNQIKQLLNGIYGGKAGNGEVGFDVREGILFDNLPKLKRSRLIDEDVLEYYADQYSKYGIHSTRKTHLPSPAPLESLAQLSCDSELVS